MTKDDNIAVGTDRINNSTKANLCDDSLKNYTADVYPKRERKRRESKFDFVNNF